MVTQHIILESHSGFLHLQETLTSFPWQLEGETKRPEEAGHEEARAALEGTVKMASAHSSPQTAQGLWAPSFRSHTTKKYML